jgi:hypothetical protein
VGACPGIAYIKDSNFVPRDLAEKWPVALRRFMNAAARARGIGRPVALSHAVVEAGVYDAPTGTALVLANFLYETIDRLEVRLPVRGTAGSVRSIERGPITFTAVENAPGAAFPRTVVFSLPLGLSDVVLVEPRR